MKTLGETGEAAFLRDLRRRLGTPGRGVEIGIGDDAAVVRGTGRWLLTTDALVEGTHFRRGWDRPAGLGRRAFAVNASDVAAMGGRPRFALLSVAVPPRTRRSDLDGLLRGFAAAAREAGCGLVGGNLSAAPLWMISVALVGEARARPLTRGGARAGDFLYVSGTLGGAALGREILLGRRRGAARDTHAFRRPTARVALGERLARQRLATAAIDVSDGLLQDLGHICRASGVGARVEAGLLPLPSSLEKLAVGKRLGFALAGGEDYELLFAASPDAARRIESAARTAAVPVTRIGTFVPGRAVRVVDAAGRILRPRGRGFDHFR